MTNPIHLDWLNNSVSSWNNKRKLDDFIPNLVSANLKDMLLRHINLDGADLQGVDLQGADLQDASLHGADLQDANLQDANLKGADLQMANLQGANLQGANLQSANLQSSNLQEANLKETDLQEANLQMANLQMANFQEAELQWADLRLAELQWANLKEANLKEANLKEADLKDADLKDADLKGSTLEGANLKGAKLQNANLHLARLQYADLQGAYLFNANLEKANFLRADFRGADLELADFKDADLQYAKFQNVKLPLAKFRGADLSMVDVTSIELDPEGGTTLVVNLSTCVGLTQDQMNSMVGDTGTIIPAEFKYPAHWPEWDSSDVDKLKNATPLAETIEIDEQGRAIAISHEILNDNLHQTAINKVQDALEDCYGGNSITKESAEAKILTRTIEKYASDPQRVHDDFVLVRNIIKGRIDDGFVQDEVWTQQLVSALSIGAMDIRSHYPEIAEIVAARLTTQFREMTDEEWIKLKENLSILPKISNPDLAEQFNEDIEVVTRSRGKTSDKSGMMDSNAGYRIASRASRIFDLVKHFGNGVKAVVDGIIYTAAAYTALEVITVMYSKLL